MYSLYLVHFSTNVDTQSCGVLCHYGNLSEHLIYGSSLTKYWKAARIFSPFTTDYKRVSGYYYIIVLRVHTVTTSITS